MGFSTHYYCDFPPLQKAFSHQDVSEIREALRMMAAPDSNVQLRWNGPQYFYDLAFMYDVPELMAALSKQKSMKTWLDSLPKDQPVYDYDVPNDYREHLRLLINTDTDANVVRLLKNMHQKTEKPIWVRRFDLIKPDRPRSRELLDCLAEITDLRTYKSKLGLMEWLLGANNAQALAYGVEHRWLRRHEDKATLLDLIQENANVSAECRALLLEAYAAKKTDTTSLAFSENQTASTLKESWSLKKAEDGTYIITGYKGTDTDVVIPEQIGRTSVTQIAPGAFAPNGPRASAGAVRRRMAVTSLLIPGTIKMVPASLFYCSHSYRKIDPSRMHIRNVTLGEGVEEIDAEAFAKCATLEHIALPHSLQKIGNAAFARSALAEIVVPESVEFLGPYVFYGCHDLKKAVIRGNIQILRKGTFSDCATLTDICLPDSVKVIKARAFEDCTGLKRIHLPASLRSLGTDVFAGCGDLTLY